MFRDASVVEQLGPFGYHAYDAWNYARHDGCGAGDRRAEFDECGVVARGASATARGTGAGFGAARGRNLIVVQVESLQDFVVDFTVGGQEVMPHLQVVDGATACASPM